MSTPTAAQLADPVFVKTMLEAFDRHMEKTMAIAPQNDDHNRNVSLRDARASRFLIKLGGGWKPRTEVPPKGRAWASDGKTVWWIWTDGEGIPDTATAVKFWMPYFVPDPPLPESTQGDV